MNGVLRVLLVDDNEDDRALVARELSREFVDCQFHHVVDWSQFTQTLESGPWDLAVTDYQLRWSDGLAVFKAIKARWPECPVVMFTGTGNEEVAVQAMKVGLDDYVIKSPTHYTRLSGTARMALERARQHKALREAEGRYQSLFNDVPVGLFRIARDGKIVDANLALVEMLGYPDREALLAVRAMNLFANPKERRALVDTLQHLGIVRMFEAQFYRRDGKIIWAAANARAIRNDQDQVSCYEGSLEDFTERKKAEKQLRDSRQQLRVLAAHLQSVREEERTRIAREVHDELGQALTGLKLDLAWLDKRNDEVSSMDILQQSEEKLKELPAVVDAIIGTVRKIATDLRPPVLDDLGLEAAVEWQAQEFERRTGISCRFHSRLSHLDLNSELATAVFRIFQETLTNIVRHADATEVNVHLRQEGGKVILEVQDNGRGMAGREPSGTQSLGLLGMRERATMLDGEVNIMSRQGSGTRVDVRIPVYRYGEGQKS